MRVGHSGPTMRASLLVLGVASALPTPEVPVTVDWSTKLSEVSTAATVEVDVMPQLSRSPHGGSFDGYFTAMQNLGSTFVRFSPWYAYPKVVVTELHPPDCSKGGRGSSWNSTLLDGIVADFMLAVCGPRAADGVCDSGLSVVPQLSTMPDWMYASDGKNRTASIPDDPWTFPSDGFGYYLVQNQPLREPTCVEMARYAARIVGWYTAGGFTDECGVKHVSSLHYDWAHLSVLNEDEYRTPPTAGVQYTTCWDAWRREVTSDAPSAARFHPF